MKRPFAFWAKLVSTYQKQTLFKPEGDARPAFVSKHEFAQSDVAGRINGIPWFAGCGRPFSGDLTMPVRQVEVRSLYQVVAVMDMPMGTLITKDQVKLVAWPASSPVSKGFTTIESVLNRGLIDSISTNEPLTETKLAPVTFSAASWICSRRSSFG